MKMLMLIKDVSSKLLQSGDKSARVTLETTSPGDIATLMLLGDKSEVLVDFIIDIEEKKE